MANEAPGLLHRINGDARPCDGKHVIATILGDDQTMPLCECERRTPEACFHDQCDCGASGCDCDSAGCSACPGGTASGAFSCADARSEEHTSELQSLMRISYAVFCLKKKNTTRILELSHSKK